MAMLYPSLISGRGTIGTNTEAWPAILRGFMLKPSNCAVTVGEMRVDGCRAGHAQATEMAMPPHVDRFALSPDYRHGKPASAGHH
jgi:hypothetical protein